MAHALLSPSSASRWLTCTPSARFEQEFPDRSSQAADEGTLAHKLGELILRFKLKEITKQKYQVELKKIQKEDLFTPDMEDHAEDYARFVMERYAEALSHTKDALIFLEQKLNMTDYVPEGFGTGDSVIVEESLLEIIDMKYGKGVLVLAEKNKQLMLYATGALKEFDFLYGIKRVRMTIYQPRMDNFSSYEMEVTELIQWARTILKQQAEMAFKGEGEFVPGEHCRFCKAKARCRALADMNLEVAKYDFAMFNKLTDEEISNILDRAEPFKNWIKSVEEFALSEAVENGKKWPNYKLVEGRSNRKYADETAVADKLIEAGFTPDKIFEPQKLLGITAMEKEITKARFTDLLAPLVVKPKGKATLAPLSDKRPELNGVEEAAKVFEGVEVE